MAQIIITGSTGRLGKAVSKLYPDALKPTRKDMDVSSKESVENYMKDKKPDVLIHLAATVAPVKCEVDKKWAWDTTVLGTMFLLEACKKANPDCYFVLMSTPCVFDGESEEAKDELALPHPDNFYGYVKAVQEMLVERSGMKHLIVRGNFAAYEKWPHPKAFTDRKSNYLFAPDLAVGIKEVVDEKLTGVVHITGDRVMSIYEMAKMCPDSEDVQPFTLEDYYRDNPNSAKLTKYMILKSNRWKSYKIKSSI